MNYFIKKYGPWALVTGASSGIGEEFARQLAVRGLNLVLVARRRERLELLSGKLMNKYGIEAKVVAIDLSRPDFLGEIQKVTDSLDIGLLVNNAGFGLTGNFLDHKIEDEESLLNVNCRAPLILAHFFGNKMAQLGRGGIINVSSVAAFLPMPYFANYAASKSYGLYFSQAIWLEFKEKGVDVLALCPGATRTEFSTVAKTKSGGMEPSEVVLPALKNLGKKTVVIPGFGNRIVVLMTRITSRQWLTKIGAKVVHGMMNRN